MVDSCRRTVEPGVGGKRRLQARLALLALEAFQQRGLLAADIGTGAVVHDELEIPAENVVLADQLGLVGLGHGGLETLALAHELAADVGVTGVRPQRERRQQGALDQQVRIVAHDLAILAGPGLRLIGIDHQIARARIALGHERPLEPGWKTGAAAAAQARGLDLGDNGIVVFFDQGFGAVPAPARPGARQSPILEAVKVLEDPILVLQSHGWNASYFVSTKSLSVVGPPIGQDACRPICEPALGGEPLANPTRTLSNNSGVRSS